MFASQQSKEKRQKRLELPSSQPLGWLSSHTFRGNMRKFFRGFLVAAATLALVFSGSVGATAFQPTAAQQSVSITAAKKSSPATIKKIGNKTVQGSKKATIKPVYKTAKKVKVTSALLTVKKGKKAVAKNKKSVALGVGTYKVTTTVKYKFNGKSSSVNKTETVVVKKAVKKKTAVKMDGKTTNCPSGFPVKGNRTGSNKEWKYHVPGQKFYKKTKPEECFKTAADARKAGYRASKV